MKLLLCGLLASAVARYNVPSAGVFRGISMCEADCEQTIGCLGISYDSVHLDCKLQQDLTSCGPSTVITQRAVAVKRASTPNRFLINCYLNNRLIYDKGNILHCIPTKDEWEPSRLLLSSKRGRDGLEINLKTKTFKKHTFPWIVNCVSYWPSKDQFIIGLREGVIMSPVAHKVKTFLKRGPSPKELFVYEDMNLILMIVVKSKTWLVSRMTLQGRKFRELSRANSPQIFLMDIDKKRKRLCVVVNWELKILTLDGEEENRMSLGGNTVVAISYNRANDALFYCDNNEINEITMTGAKENVGSLMDGSTYVQDLTISWQHAYILVDDYLDRSRSLYVKDLVTESESQKLNVDRSFNALNVKLCLF